MLKFFRKNNYFSPLLSLIFILLISTGLLGFVEPVGSPIKLVLACVVFFKFIRASSRIVSRYLLFAIYLFLNILIVQPSPYFHPWERLLLFLSMFIVVSPFLISEYAIKFRWKALQFFLLIATIFSFLSFFGFFLGINMFVRNGVELDDYASNAGWFSGFFRHSMILGPMSAISACYMLYYYYQTKKKLFLLIMIPLIGSVMFAASRTAFLALIVSLIFLIGKRTTSKEKFAKILCSIVFVSLVTIPVWSGGLSRMEQKSSEDQFGSRTHIWNARLDEFVSSPILGVGFCSQKTSIMVESEGRGGKVEPGSSWLATLSMTGIIGFSFVFFFFWDAYKIVKKSQLERSIFLMAILIFFSIHMISEGYIFGGGNPMCVLLWLVLGCCYDLKWD